MEILTERKLSFGEQLVGLNFNPSADDKANPMHSMMYENAIGEVLNAQMNTVKILTLKY
jgi:hypothetical protein